MGELFTPAHIIVLLMVSIIIFLLPAIFFILTLQSTLRKCALQSRTLDPSLIWLYIIPVVNLVFGFFIVVGMSKSLRNEFDRRGMVVPDQEPGKAIGMAMCVCACCGMIPFIGILAYVASIVLWIIYWVKITEFSRALDMQSLMVAPQMNAI